MPKVRFTLVFTDAGSGIHVTAACPSTSILVKSLQHNLAPGEYRVMSRKAAGGRVAVLTYRDNGYFTCATTLTAAAPLNPLTVTGNDLQWLQSGGTAMLSRIILQLDAARPTDVVGKECPELLSLLFGVPLSQILAALPPPPADVSAWMLKSLPQLQEACAARMLPKSGNKVSHLSLLTLYRRPLPYGWPIVHTKLKTAR